MMSLQGEALYGFWKHKLKELLKMQYFSIAQTALVQHVHYLHLILRVIQCYGAMSPGLVVVVDTGGGGEPPSRLQHRLAGAHPAVEPGQGGGGNRHFEVKLS